MAVMGHNSKRDRPPSQKGAGQRSARLHPCLVRIGRCALCLLLSWSLGSKVVADVSGDQDEDTSTPPAVPNQFLIRWNQPGGTLKREPEAGGWGDGLRLVRELAAMPVKSQVQAMPLRPPEWPRFTLVEVVEPQSGGARLQRLRADPRVAFIEPNYQLHLLAGSGEHPAPNDFEFGRQWGLHNSGQDSGMVGADIHALEAWQYVQGDQGITVAIIDTGVDYYHPDLEANLWINPGETPGNDQDDDQNGYMNDIHGFDFVSRDGDPMDDLGHGTHVAGIIGAVNNNGIGISGVCRSVRLMAVKAFDASGSATLADVVEGIRYAVDNGAKIINASWGQSQSSRALEETVQQATRAGVLIVAAGGNERAKKASYPAAIPEALGVAATDNRDRRGDFSNYGEGIDIAAPGVKIFSTLPDAGYENMSGTSMAAPFVSGAAALVLQMSPDVQVGDLVEVLRNAVDPIEADRYIGLGRLNLAKALRTRAPLPIARLAPSAFLQGRAAISGTASGASFHSYVLSVGQGVYPTNWTEIRRGNQAVVDGELVRDWYTGDLDEGEHCIRLVVFDLQGQTAEERMLVEVRNVHLTAPASNDILPAGKVVDLTGSVFGEGRTYQLEIGLGTQPQHWSTTGIRTVSDGTNQVLAGKLGELDTSLLQPHYFHALRLTAWQGSRKIKETGSFLLYPEDRAIPGWPVHLPTTRILQTNDWRDFAVVDLEGRGKNNVVRVSPGDPGIRLPELLVFDPDGSVLWRRDLEEGSDTLANVVCMDLDGDGKQEIAVCSGSRGALSVFRSDGKPQSGDWPVLLGPRLVGLSGARLLPSSESQLLVHAMERTDRPESLNRQLLVLDSRGAVLKQWEIPGSSLVFEVPPIPPVGFRRGTDHSGCIVVPWGDNELALFSLDMSSGPTWRRAVAGRIVTPAVVGDLDDDGTYDIVQGVANDLPSWVKSSRGGLYAFDEEGGLLPGWPVLKGESISSALALGDLTGDGRLEIAVPGWDAGLLHLIQPNGFEMPGWPIIPGSQGSWKSGVSLGDLDGDGRSEILTIRPGRWKVYVLSPDPRLAGGVVAYRSDGTLLDLNESPELSALTMESAGANRLKALAPVVADLDGDGSTDVLAATIEDAGYSPAPTTLPKNRYSIFAWHSPAGLAAETGPWGQYQRDATRNGWLQKPIPIPLPPSIRDLPSQAVAPGNPFFSIQLDQFVTDPDTEPAELTWTVTGNQALSVRITDSRLLIVEAPSPAWIGLETLSVRVVDPSGLEDHREVQYEVRAGYQGPRAAPDQAEMLEESSVVIDVLRNDSSPAGLPLQLISVSRPGHGSAVALPGGGVEYLPATNFFGEDSFQYQVADGQGGVAVGQVSLSVVSSPDAPRAVPDYFIIDEDSPVSLNILANDTDPDGDPIRIKELGQPSHGVIRPDGLNGWIYVPETNFAGTDGFDYAVVDSSGLAGSSTVSILIKPVNDPPVVEAQSFMINRNTYQNVDYLGSDAEGGDLSFEILKGPEHGELWNYPRTSTYYPKKGYSGEDSFTYRAKDAESVSEPALVRFQVLDKNNPPKADALSLITRVGQTLSVGFSAIDPDGDPVTFRVVRDPFHGTLVGEGTNYLYRPMAGFEGEDSFLYGAQDSQGAAGEAEVKVQVTDQNTAPVAVSETVEIRINVPTKVTFRASDLEGSPLSFIVLTNPVHGVLSGEGAERTFSPEKDFLGWDRVTFLASDGETNSPAATLTLSIVPLNRPAVAKDQWLSFVQTNLYSVPLDLVDPDGDLLRCVILNGPKAGLLFGSGTNFSYVPHPGALGPDSFTYRAWDGRKYSSVARVNLLVLSPPLEKPGFYGIQVVDQRDVLLRFHGKGGSRLEVQWSADLTQWQTLAQVEGKGEEMSYRDTGAAVEGMRYYRLLQRD